MSPRAARSAAKSEQLRARMAEAENAAAVQAAALHKNLRQAELQADVQVMQQELATAKLTNTQRLQLEADLLRKKDELIAADLRGAGGGRSAKGPSALSQRGGGPEARSQYEDFAAGEREKIAAAQATVPSSAEAGAGGAASQVAAARSASAQIQAIYQEWAARAKAQFGDTSREYQNVMRAMTEATTREAATQAREIAAASRAAYEQFAGAERDKIAAAQGATSQILAIYQEWADRAKAVFGEQSTQYANVVRQMTEAANRASEQMQAAFAKPFDSLGSSAERALTGLLTHQTTVGKAEQEAYRGLIGSSVDELGTAANKTLASSLFGSGTKSLGEGLVGMLGIGKPGGLFGTGLGAVTGETTETTLATAVTANTAAVTANTAALTTSAGAAVSGGALSGAGGIASGAGSFLGGLPLIGSLFGGGAVSGAVDQDFSGGVGIGGGGLFAGLGALFGFKGGGIMPRATGAIMPRTTFRLPSYAAGGFAVPGLAKLHENEMVLPAHISNFVQNAAAAASGRGAHGGGDTHLHFHGPVDGPAIERFLTPFIRRAVPGAVQNAFRQMRSLHAQSRRKILHMSDDSAEKAARLAAEASGDPNALLAAIVQGFFDVVAALAHALERRGVVRRAEIAEVLREMAERAKSNDDAIGTRSLLVNWMADYLELPNAGADARSRFQIFEGGGKSASAPSPAMVTTTTTCRRRCVTRSFHGNRPPLEGSQYERIFGAQPRAVGAGNRT